MTEPEAAAQDEVEIDYDEKRARRFYTRLRRRLVRWFKRGGKVGGAAGEVLLLLPDFFALVMRLMRDPRVDRWTKVQLGAVIAYVISPIDLIPDFLLPFGMIDDTVALAFALSRVAVMMEGAGDDALQEHWEGSGSVLRAIRTVIGTADDLLSGRIVKRLRRRFGLGGGSED